MTDEDRPIKPDQKYLEEYLQKINKVEVKPYLKKKEKPILPCFAYRDVNEEIKEKERQRKTKAEIYYDIKEKNLKKFGEKKAILGSNQEKTKRIHPKKMTIAYKSKVHILIQEYKKKDHITRPMSQQMGTDNKEKLEYEKLIDYFNKELKDLEREKEEFTKVAEKLKFKQSIRKEEGLFFSQVKSQVQKILIKSAPQPPKSQQQNQKINIQSRQNSNKMRKKKECLLLENLSKTYSVGDIRDKLSKTCQQMQAIKTQILNRNLEIKQHKYQIDQAHLLPNFQPQTIYEYINIAKLRYNGNSQYQSALDAFNSKFDKENKPSPNLCEIPQQSPPLKPKIKEKFIGDKRISKYNDWTEVWIPGKQRLMANTEGYKVVWLSNGDVIQQFKSDIKVYYSKVKDICKIQYKEQPIIYYHDGLKQLWRYLPNNQREVVFENGRLEVVEE